MYANVQYTIFKYDTEKDKRNKNAYIKLKQAGLKFSLSSTPQHVM